MVTICRVSDPCGAFGALMKVVFSVWDEKDEFQPPWRVNDLASFRVMDSAYISPLISITFAGRGLMRNKGRYTIRILTTA